MDLQQSLLHLNARLERAPEGVTLAYVSRLLNHWKNDRSEDEKDWLYDDFAEDLEEFSEAHLKAACQAWRREKPFPPKVSDIRALCLKARGLDQEMHRRARVLLGLEAPRSWEALPAPHKAITLGPAREAMLATAMVGQQVGFRKKA